MTLELEKSRARIQAKAVRAAAHDRAAGVELIKHFPISEFRGAEIGGFWPIQTEIDPRPLLEALESMSKEYKAKQPVQCPPKKSELGRSSWKLLHTMVCHTRRENGFLLLMHFKHFYKHTSATPRDYVFGHLSLLCRW